MEQRVPSKELMRGIRGVFPIVDPAKSKWVRNLAAQLSGYIYRTDVVGGEQGFPGAKPARLETKHLPRLIEEPYQVTWKSEGVRFLMVIADAGRVYLLDEGNNVFATPTVSFPRYDKPHKLLFNTLLDGELVMDRKDGKIVPRYLVRDIVHCGFSRLTKLNSIARQQFIKDKIIGLRDWAIGLGRLNLAKEPFLIAAKEFHDVHLTEKLLPARFGLEAMHDIQGLIFQPTHSAYTPGHWPDSFEWNVSDSTSPEGALLRIVCGEEVTAEQTAAASKAANGGPTAHKRQAPSDNSCIGRKRAREDDALGNMALPPPTRSRSQTQGLAAYIDEILTF